MVILYDSTTTHKTSTRRRPFGTGIRLSEVRQPYSTADLDAAAQILNADSDCYVVVGYNDATLDRLAGEAACQASMDQWPAHRGGVSLDPVEEVGRRYNLSPEVEAELDRDLAEYDAYQAAMSRWINGHGPRPE